MISLQWDHTSSKFNVNLYYSRLYVAIIAKYFFTCTVSSILDSVTVSSNVSTPSIGSAITLICTVELSPLLGVAANISTKWMGPAGLMISNTAQPVIGSTTTYTSSAIVSFFVRNTSGIYSCTATVNSTSTFHIGSGSESRTGNARVTVGKMNRPINYTLLRLSLLSVANRHQGRVTCLST